MTACLDIIHRIEPAYWIMENVRGSAKYISPLLGRAKKVGPFYLWGEFPIFDVKLEYRKKESYSSTQAAERGKIPYAISLAVCLAVEQGVNEAN